MKPDQETYEKQPFVIYARRSEWGDKISINRQIKKCRDYARDKPLVERGVFDEYRSGYEDPLHRRNKLVGMMDYVKDHGIKIVLVDHIDRLSRSVMQGAFLLNWFNSLGIVVYDVNYLNSPTHQTINPGHSWQYRQDLYKRLINAENYYHSHTIQKHEVIKQNYLFYGRTPPLGFTKEGCHPACLRKDETTAKIVDTVMQLALKLAPSATEHLREGKKINYTKLYKKLSLDPVFEGIKDELRAMSVKKRLDSQQALRNFLQTPFYAGYARTGEQEEASRVHEFYISLKEYNLLNKGYNHIALRRTSGRSYVSIIACSCGEGNLNLNGQSAVCRKCKNSTSVREEELAAMLTETLCHYQIDKEHSFLDHMERRLKIGMLGFTLKQIYDSISQRVDSGIAAIDMKALKQTGGGRELMDRMKAVLQDIEAYHDKEYGELAALWKEAHCDGLGREFIKMYGLKLSFQQVSRTIIVEQYNPGIVVSTKPKTLDEIDSIVERRANLRGKIKDGMETMPGLIAVLEYDMGVATGDFWTKFSEMLF